MKCHYWLFLIPILLSACSFAPEDPDKKRAEWEASHQSQIAREKAKLDADIALCKSAGMLPQIVFYQFAHDQVPWVTGCLPPNTIAITKR